MSLACGFFNSEDGDRQYFNQDLSNFLEGLVEDGIYEFIGDKMMVSASATPDMYVFVGKGRAWFNGTWTKIDAAYQVEIPSADSVLNRIDAICLTINKTRAVRDNYIEIISGTGTVDAPTKPTVTDETDVYRHVLAYVTVLKGTTAITQASIENRVGMGSALFAYPKWGNVPTTEEMVAQWQTQFDEFMDHIHETFDYDAAGHLQDEIDDINEIVSGKDDTPGGVEDSTDLYTSGGVFATVADLREAFQAGVDAVYNAVVAEGVTPASSTPTDIAAAIATIRNGGTATAAQIVEGYKAYSGKQLLTGTRKQTGTYTFPSGDTGGTKDLGVQNTYRYVNAANVYNKGFDTARNRLTYRYHGTSAGTTQYPITYAQKGFHLVVLSCDTDDYGEINSVSVNGNCTIVSSWTNSHSWGKQYVYLVYKSATDPSGQSSGRMTVTGKYFAWSWFQLTPER